MEDKQNLAEIHIIISSEDEASTCTVSGKSNKILGALFVVLHRVATDCGYTVEEMLDILKKTFTDFDKIDKIEEG